nr:MAG TPA: tail protein [Bacteriophage sp.]
MAIQSFNLPVDFLNNLEKPIIYIAKKDKTFLGAVSIYDDLSLTFNLNAFQTASFKIYRDINGKKYEHYDDFQEDRLIMIQGIGWYKIHVETNIENTGISKNITANSLECTLCNKRLVDFQVNSDDFEDEKYARTIFYNPADLNKSLLHRVLNVAPNWSVGHVDQSIANKQRTFDIDDSDVYSFLINDVSEAFNCLFIFDTVNMTVNAYDLDNYGDDTNIFVSMDNLVQSMEETIDENSIITCYRVVGGDNVEVAEINPNGTNKIYNFEYYLPEMEESIQNKVIAYNEKYQSLKLTYQSITDRMRQQLDVIQELYTRNPESAESTDWSLYGLYMLQDKRDSYKNVDEVYCAQGMNKPDSFNYNLYAKNKELLDSVQVELDKRQTEVESAEATYNSIKAEMTSLQEQLDMDKWFTKDEWKTLDTYVVEETYSNDNYSIADNTTDVELFDIEKQLYDVAWKDLSKKCRPQYQYKSTLSNVLTIPQFKGFLKYFQLGNFIRMATDYDTVIKLRLISFTVDYNDTSKIDVTFSDAIRVHGVCNDVASIISQANSAAMSFQFNKDQYDKSVNQSNFVEEMRKYGLDVANIPVKNQHQSWDETGMWFRQWNEQKNDFDPEQIKIINNQIVFSDDGFQSAKMAIGKIPIDKNGNTVYAVNAEAILGKLFLGEYLTLQNNSGTYKFDDAGFIASSGKNSVRIQPNQSGELFSIYKGNQKQVYINSDGDVEFAGILKSSSGVFGGLISGGSINIGNGMFLVDSNGNMTAKSGTFGNNCTFKGTLDGVKGNFSGDITGASGTFGSVILNDSGISSPQFSIDLYGNATFTGNLIGNNIIGSTITGSNITGSTISAVDSEFTNATFYDGINYGFNWNGNNYKCKIISVPQLGVLDFGGSDTHTNFYGSVKFNDSRVYIGSDRVATKSDIPNMSNYVKKSDLSDYATRDWVNTRITQVKNWVKNNFKAK